MRLTVVRHILEIGSAVTILKKRRLLIIQQKAKLLP